MAQVVQFPKSGKQVAVIPERVFDPLNGWMLTVDQKILNDLRDRGRTPAVIPLYDEKGEIDIAIFAYLRETYNEVHANKDLTLRLQNDDGLHSLADEFIARRLEANRSLFYPRAIVAPDLKNGEVRLSQRFTNAVRYGSRAVPVIVTHQDELASLIDFVNAGGFFLPGSDSDYHPVHYNGIRQGPEDQYDIARDRLVETIVKTAYAQDLPFFGICSGIQGMAIFSGHGYRLHQDLSILDRHEHATGYEEIHAEHFDATRLETNERHGRHRKPGARNKPKRYQAVHNVIFREGTFISALLGNPTVEHTVPVNSSHRQAIEESSVGSEVSVEGMAPDGTIEALHDRHGKFILGVQFHPEALYMENVTQHPLEKKLYRRLFWAFGQALEGWSWRDIIRPRAGSGNWRNRGMARVYMTVPGSIHQTPEFVTGLRENVLIP